MSSLLGSPSPSPQRSGPQRASLCHDGAKERISFYTDSLGWFSEDKMFRAWMNQDLEGESGVRRTPLLWSMKDAHWGETSGWLLLHSCFRLPWGISLHFQQGRGQRGQALLGISAGRIPDSQRWCMASPSTTAGPWKAEGVGGSS